MAKKKSVFGTILKIILGILGVVVLVVVGGYCYLKFALGIDVIDISKKINLISQPVAESEIISNSFEKDDGVDVLSSMFGTNEIATKNGDKYSFNLEAYIQADLQGDLLLTDKEVASLLSLFIEGVDVNSSGIDKDLIGLITLKQIKFSNFVDSVDSTSVDINYVFMADISAFKQNIVGENALIGFLANKFLPDKLYISSTLNIQMPKENYRDYSFTNKSFCLNNLNQEQTNSILDIFSLFSNEDLKETMPNKFNTMFCDSLFGGNGKKGVLGNIKEFASIEFVEEINNIKIFIKKV